MVYYGVAALAGSLLTIAYRGDGDERFGAIVVLVIVAYATLSALGKYGYP